jgi:hypothetical protein
LKDLEYIVVWGGKGVVDLIMAPTAAAAKEEFDKRGYNRTNGFVLYLKVGGQDD